jgi:NhaP-type Na+/H+ or K+/H+ antiporter
MNTWGFELDQFAGFMFFMFTGGAGFGLVLGLLRFLLLTFIERNEA